MPDTEFPLHFERLRSNLQNTNWAVLLGAGTSVCAGLPTMKKLTELVLEKLETTNKRVYRLVYEIFELLYLEKQVQSPDNPYVTIEDILEVLYQIKTLKLDRHNVCISLRSLRRLTASRVDECIKHIKNICVDEVNKYDVNLNGYKEFLSFWLSGINQAFIFTTNWDNLLERSCDLLNMSPDTTVHCIDGFKGNYLRVFSPSTFNEKRTSNTGRNLKTINYYKLHGGLNWRKHNDLVISATKEYLPEDADDILIYPSPMKHKEILASPYMELMRFFSNTLDTCNYLLVIGTSFPDEHINNIIRDSLKNPFFNLFVVDPNLNEDDLSKTFGNSNKINKPINLCFSCLTRFLNGGELYESFMGRQCDVCNR